jgi:hypothetical protein
LKIGKDQNSDRSSHGVNRGFFVISP